MTNKQWQSTIALNVFMQSATVIDASLCALCYSMSTHSRHWIGKWPHKFTICWESNLWLLVWISSHSSYSVFTVQFAWQVPWIALPRCTSIVMVVMNKSMHKFHLLCRLTCNQFFGFPTWTMKFSLAWLSNGTNIVAENMVFCREASLIANL